ncbi:MAG: bifunctional DNA-formamidopyrimidine glycosylase/DNA-(apurinic or apyrimidinic site) lyase [Phycisphaerales bacterium]|nr:bifunctional DNA-formamidopyrimidine glycosylase/DNA-(apurinic or apyrimidinic site) lyase [Phycisphaerales bacterium]
MPELPEVEIVRRGVDEHVVRTNVTSVQVRRRDVILGVDSRSPREVQRALLRSDVVERTDRRGKYLALIGRSGRAVIVHLGMTGSLRVLAQPPDPDERHVHVVWKLSREGETKYLAFRDPRRFGFIRACASVDELEHLLEHLGPDALSISAAQLRAAFHGRKAPVKAALLNQRLLAGVGNIYADEALHRARIHPALPCGQLQAEELTQLAAAIRQVLRMSLDRGGSSIRDYRNPSGRPGRFQQRHRVYGRGGKSCPGCRGVLEMARIAQRTTTFCPQCQPIRGSRYLMK